MNDLWNQVWLVVAGLLPFLGFLVVCYIIVRAIFNADRNERKAQAQWQAEQNRAEQNTDGQNTPEQNTAEQNPAGRTEEQNTAGEPENEKRESPQSATTE